MPDRDDGLWKNKIPTIDCCVSICRFIRTLRGADSCLGFGKQPAEVGHFGILHRSRKVRMSRDTRTQQSIEMGQFQIERNTLDIAALTRRVIADIQLTLEKHTITLRDAEGALLVDGDQALKRGYSDPA